MVKNIQITSTPSELKEGLFGQVMLFIFEVLPYLDERDLMPDWAIRSKLYGNPNDDFLVVPGLLELNYEPMRGNAKVQKIGLKKMRRYATSTLGNDWRYLNGLLLKYFRIPRRIIDRADAFPELNQALGLHYRGTDKNKSSSETNYVSEADFMTLAADFLSKHPEVRVIFTASDEDQFVEKMRVAHPGSQIVSSGEVVHHKNLKAQDNFAKGDHAMLDCLLLSRCKYLLKCQSALSGFAKVLNPEIQAYRISANKLAPWAPETPYFPDAYLPKYSSENSECQRVLQRLFREDWTENESVVEKHRDLFGYKKRSPNPPENILNGLIQALRQKFERLQSGTLAS